MTTPRITTSSCNSCPRGSRRKLKQKLITPFRYSGDVLFFHYPGSAPRSLQFLCESLFLPFALICFQFRLRRTADRIILFNPRFACWNYTPLLSFHLLRPARFAASNRFARRQKSHFDTWMDFRVLFSWLTNILTGCAFREQNY